MKISITLAALTVTGCASMSTETRVEETAYQAAVMLDTAQTISMAGRHPDIFIEAREFHINGYRPNTREILTYQLSMAALHFGGTWLLSQGEPRPWKAWAPRAWEGWGLATEISAISCNFEVNRGHLFPTTDTLNYYRGI